MKIYNVSNIRLNSTRVGSHVHYLYSQNNQCPADMKSKLLEALNEAIYFDEITVGFTRMQTDCRDFIASLKIQGINMDEIIPPG